MKTIFVAKDGKQFEDRKACELYEKTIGKTVVKDYKEVVDIITKEVNQEIDSLDELYQFAQKLVADYEKENDKFENLYITENGHKIYGELLVENIFKTYYKKVVRKYYDGFEKASDGKIEEVFAHAYSRFHSEDLQAVIDEFDTLVKLIQNFI